MKGIPEIGSVMTPLPRSVDRGASLVEAWELMQAHGIRHLPVTNSGKLVGIVSDRDIQRSLDPLVNYPTAHDVGGIMIPDPYVVGTTEPLDRVLFTLAERRIGCAIVADNGNLAGIFTTTDAARILAERLRSGG